MSGGSKQRLVSGQMTAAHSCDGVLDFAGPSEPPQAAHHCAPPGFSIRAICFWKFIKTEKSLVNTEKSTLALSLTDPHNHHKPLIFELLSMFHICASKSSTMLINLTSKSFLPSITVLLFITKTMNITTSYIMRRHAHRHRYMGKLFTWKFVINVPPQF